MIGSLSRAQGALLFFCAGFSFLAYSAEAQTPNQQRTFHGFVTGINDFYRGALRSDEPEVAARMAMATLSQIELTYAAAIVGDVTIEQHLLYRSSMDIQALRDIVVAGWRQDISDRMIKRYIEGCQEFMEFHANHFSFGSDLPDVVHTERMRPFDILPNDKSTYYVLALSGESPHPMEAYEIAPSDLERVKGSILARGMGFQTFFQIEGLERFVAPEDRSKIKGEQYFVGIYEDAGTPILDILASTLRAPDVSYCFLF